MEKETTTVARSQLVEIGPEEASRLLARNDGNRRIKPQVVAEYSKAMRKGHWELNGEAIIVADTGRLLDGQHRLAAVIESGVRLPFFLNSGVRESSFATIDQGIRRSQRDLLEVDGEQHSNILAPAIRLIACYREAGHFSVNAFRKFSGSASSDYLERFPQIRCSAAFASQLGSRRTLKATQCAALHFLFSEKSPRDAESFLTKLQKGVDLREGEPVYVISDWLAKRRQRYLRYGNSGSVAEALTGVVYAWNAHREGRRIRNVSIVDRADQRLRKLQIV